MNSQTNTPRTDQSTSNAGSWMDRVKFVIAAAAIIALGLLIWYMLGQTKTEEKEWSRVVYLFQGVEAIAFAAAGFLFGKEVHRERAEKAEKRANEKEDAAAKGKALAEMVKAKSENQPARDSRFAAALKMPESAVNAAQMDLDDLASIAKQMFP